MGITGLLKALKSIQKPTHVSALRGKKVGVDMYCWLHKAIYACPEDLVAGRPTHKYPPLRHLDYCVRRALELRSAGVQLVLVFDGAQLPHKLQTELNREE